MDKLQKSPNWDKRKNAPGFPFKEGFPKKYRNKSYVIITRDGEKRVARVNDDHQYEADGLSWVTTTNEVVNPQAVMCWKEFPLERLRPGSHILYEHGLTAGESGFYLSAEISHVYAATVQIVPALLERYLIGFNSLVEMANIVAIYAPADGEEIEVGYYKGPFIDLRG